MDHEYIFRIPEGTPELRFEVLDALLRAKCDHDRCETCELKLGTTVTVRWHGPKRSGNAALPPAINIALYDVRIAKLMPESVYFPRHGDGHMATGYWLSKVVYDNGLGHRVWRARRRKGDPVVRVPRGLAGPLAIDGDRDRLVEGQVYPVDRERIARNEEYAAKLAARLAEMRA